MMIRLSTGNSRMEKKWNLAEMELSDLRERISTTRRTSETVEQYRKMSKAQQDSIKDVGGFVLGTLKGGRRKKDTVLTRSGLTLDMDYGTPDIMDEIEMFFDFHCMIYSTHKHTPEKPRLRLIIPLSREVNSSMIPPTNPAASCTGPALRQMVSSYSGRLRAKSSTRMRCLPNIRTGGIQRSGPFPSGSRSLCNGTFRNRRTRLKSPVS